MQLFEQLFDIIHHKECRIQNDIEDEKDFSPYLIQRWLSMYSPNFAVILNNSSNIFWKTLDSKLIWYKYFTAILPKSNIKRIVYIKKQKNEKNTNDDDLVKYIANVYELSTREVKEYLLDSSVDVKSLKKQLGYTK